MIASLRRASLSILALSLATAALAGPDDLIFAPTVPDGGTSFWRAANWRNEAGVFGHVPAAHNWIYLDAAFSGTATGAYIGDVFEDGSVISPPAFPSIAGLRMFNSRLDLVGTPYGAGATQLGVLNVFGSAGLPGLIQLENTLSLWTQVRADVRGDMLVNNSSLQFRGTHGIAGTYDLRVRGDLSVSNGSMFLNESAKGWIEGDTTLNGRLSVFSASLLDAQRVIVTNTGLTPTFARVQVNTSGTLNVGELTIREQDAAAELVSVAGGVANIALINVENGVGGRFYVGNGRLTAITTLLSGTSTLRAEIIPDGLFDLGDVTVSTFGGSIGHLNLDASGGVVRVNTFDGTYGDSRLRARNNGEIRIGATNIFAPANTFEVEATRTFRVQAEPTGLVAQSGFMGIGGDGTVEFDIRGSFLGGRVVSTPFFSYAETSQLSLNAADNQIVADAGTFGFTQLQMGSGAALFNGATMPHLSMILNGNTVTVRGSSQWVNPVGATRLYQNSAQVGQFAPAHLKITDSSRADHLRVWVQGPAGSPSTLEVKSGARMTGRLELATSMAGTEATAWVDNAFAGFSSLGIGAYKNLVQGPPGMYDVWRGGTAELNVINGGRVSVGGYDADGTWVQQPNEEAAVTLNDGAVLTVDATSSMFIGDLGLYDPGAFVTGWVNLGPNGFLYGAGTVNASLWNSGGTWSPGFSPATQTVTGTYQMDAGDLILEIGGTATSDYDRIFANQIVINGGRIIFRAANGFTGAPATLSVLNAPSLTFGSGFNFTTGIVNETGFGLTFHPATGQVETVPEPASLAALGVALVAFARRRRSSA